MRILNISFKNVECYSVTQYKTTNTHTGREIRGFFVSCGITQYHLISFFVGTTMGTTKFNGIPIGQ